MAVSFAWSFMLRRSPSIAQSRAPSPKTRLEAPPGAALDPRGERVAPELESLRGTCSCLYCGEFSVKNQQVFEMISPASLSLGLQEIPGEFQVIGCIRLSLVSLHRTESSLPSSSLLRRFCVFWIAYQVASRPALAMHWMHFDLTAPANPTEAPGRRWQMWFCLVHVCSVFFVLERCWMRPRAQLGWGACNQVIGFAVMRVIGALFLNETHLGIHTHELRSSSIPATCLKL